MKMVIRQILLSARVREYNGGDVRIQQYHPCMRTQTGSEMWEQHRFLIYLA